VCNAAHVARATADPFDLAGRVALVTGCGSADGIGFAAARFLFRLGAAVAITSTTKDRIEARAEELQTGSAGVFAQPADLTDRRQAFELVAATRAALGPIDVLVNAAGMAQTGVDPVSAPFAELSPEAFERELDITLKTAFHMTQAVLLSMVERKFGPDRDGVVHHRSPT
jgi:3-oxoacyl-[acyl-carrier protein] reductase